ncbi:hypothetical protein CsatB_021874 [Cannabis sativa]
MGSEEKKGTQTQYIYVENTSISTIDNKEEEKEEKSLGNVSVMMLHQMNFHQKFKPKDDDIILASIPKSGTTKCLNSLVFSILNRNNLHDHNNCRLISTHIPYASFPDSIKHYSKSRIVYLSRNPLDVIVTNNKEGFSSMEECVDMFCRGESVFGPFWDHVLGFWKASLEKRDKVLFLKYEEMKEDNIGQAKRVAEFVGIPFSKEEEKNGIIEQVLLMNKLKEDDHDHDHEVGDWMNHLTPSMVKCVNNIMKEKLCGSGLSFKMS